MNPPAPRAKDGTKLTRIVNLFDEDYDVYIGRKGFGMDGYFGNPYRLNKDGPRHEIMMKYQKYFRKRLNNDPDFATKIRALRGMTLGCYCKPRACHGDFIAAYLNGYMDGTTGTDQDKPG